MEYAEIIKSIFVGGQSTRRLPLCDNEVDAWHQFLKNHLESVFGVSEILITEALLERGPNFKESDLPASIAFDSVANLFEASSSYETQYHLNYLVDCVCADAWVEFTKE